MYHGVMGVVSKASSHLLKPAQILSQLAIVLSALCMVSRNTQCFLSNTIGRDLSLGLWAVSVGTSVGLMFFGRFRRGGGSR